MDVLYYKDYFVKLQQYVREQGANSREITRIDYGPGKSVRLCPEPVRFLSKLDQFANSRENSQAAFERMAEGFERISLEQQPSWIWFNSTKRGINLRPGDDADTRKPRCVTLGDVTAHGLMAGQTGSGKSVLLNNLIFNMLAEYPPWELDLYLADFKRVEFSRYMNDVSTPHVCACAATGEVRYVLSLISYLVDCMNAREEFFSRLGLTKLEAFRDKYPDLVLPRMLLIVDEFQQLFLEASTQEGEQVRRLLTAIVKKGRATGLHILFSSQEMGQTLSRNSLANFRLRFALNCSPGVSMDVLGNRGAAMIRRGSVLVNTADGTEEQNQKFVVPYIETEEQDGGTSYFYEYLQGIAQYAEAMKFSKSQKFYKEELQEPFDSLEDILARIRDYRKACLMQDSRYYDVLTLGPYVTFSNLRHDIQTLFIENGRSKNILAVSPRVEDLAYLEKLFSANFAASPKGEVTGAAYCHEIYSFQPVLRSLFPLEKATGQSTVHANPEDLDALALRFARQRMLLPLFQQCRTPYEFALSNYRANLNAQSRSYSVRDAAAMEEQAVPILRSAFEEIDMEDIPAAVEKLRAGDDPMMKIIAGNLLDFYRYRKNPYDVFPPTVYWLIGVDSLERMPDWLTEMLKNGMDVNTLFIMMASSEFDQMGMLAKYCDYIFAGGSNSRIYDRLHMNYTFREVDSIVLDLYVKSIEEDRSFKKYRCDFEKAESPSIPFDELL